MLYCEGLDEAILSMAKKLLHFSAPANLIIDSMNEDGPIWKVHEPDI
jgi:hypothetical protein